jgi:hypothetical protein
VPDRLSPDKLAVTFLTDRDGNIVGLSASLEPVVRILCSHTSSAGDCTVFSFRERCVGNFKRRDDASCDAGSGRPAYVEGGNQPAYRLAPQEAEVPL